MSRFNNDYWEPKPLEIGRLIAQFKNVLITHPERTKTALLDLKAALEAMPVKKLGHGNLCYKGQVCALGAYAAYKGISKRTLAHIAMPHKRDWDDNYQDPDKVSKWAAENLPITLTLAYLIQDVNDDYESWDTEEERYRRMLAWVDKTLANPQATFKDVRDGYTAWFENP